MRTLRLAGAWSLEPGAGHGLSACGERCALSRLQAISEPLGGDAGVLGIQDASSHYEPSLLLGTA
ncbi:hypothetical protein M9458_056924, partial [Cirrhinus mrigala]